MTGIPEPHEKRDLRRATDTTTTADTAAATTEPPATPAPAPARRRRTPLSRQELERLRRSLKARFH